MSNPTDRQYECYACAEKDAEIERLRDDVDHYQQMLDEIVVALGSFGLTHSEIVKEIERLREDLGVVDAWRNKVIAENTKLQAVVDAAKDDMECAKANCGQYPEAKEFSGKDCSAFVERGLRCSDCPVDVWLASTSEALAALEEADDV